MSNVDLKDSIIFDKQGMLIQKSSSSVLSNNVGILADIVNKSRTLLDGDDTFNTINIVFDKKTICIVDNASNNLSIANMIDNK